MLGNTSGDAKELQVNDCRHLLPQPTHVTIEQYLSSSNFRRYDRDAFDAWATSNLDTNLTCLVSVRLKVKGGDHIQMSKTVPTVVAGKCAFSVLPAANLRMVHACLRA